VATCAACRARPAAAPSRYCWHPACPLCWLMCRECEEYRAAPGHEVCARCWRRRPKRPRAPRAPTAALPGTPAKVAVLASRAARGESLWHPGDAGDVGAVSRSALARLAKGVTRRGRRYEARVIAGGGWTQQARPAAVGGRTRQVVLFRGTYATAEEAAAAVAAFRRGRAA
jgi:hypothetical protein